MEVTDTQQFSRLDDLSEREQELIEASRRGAVLVCSELSTDDLAASRATDHVVRAELVRDLLLGRFGPLDPQGVQIQGARLIGPLNLDHCTCGVGLRLVGCAAGELFFARNAHLPWLDIADSRLHLLHAYGLRVDNELRLAGTRIRGDDPSGGIDLLRARVGGLILDNVEIVNQIGPALRADWIQVDSAVLFINAHLSGTDIDGAVQLPGARVGNRVVLEDTKITNQTGPALHADDLHIDNGILLRRARFTGSGEHGAVRFYGARTADRLRLDDVEIVNHNGPALQADSLCSEDGVWLDNTRMTGAGEGGAFRLFGARLGGTAHLDNVEITNDTGPAVMMERLHVEGSIRLLGARISGAGALGALRMARTHVAGELVLDDVEIVNQSGPALLADGLSTEGDLRLEDARVTGAGMDGAVRLIRAHVGELCLDRAEIVNQSGPALMGDGLRTKAGIRFDNARLTGAGKLGAVRLLHTQIGGQLTFEGAAIAHTAAGVTLDLEDAAISHTLHLPAKLVCPDPRPSASCVHTALVNVTGLTFRDLAQIDWRKWLHIVRCHTLNYWPQPYQHLARMEQAAGHDGNARQILIAQQKDLYHRAGTGLEGWWTRRFHQLWGAFAGYGYRARRLTAALLLALVASCSLAWWSGQITSNDHYAAERTATFDNPVGEPCSTVELVGVGIDRGLPLSPTGVRAHCDLNVSTTAGQVFTVAIWAVQAVVWGLATLALAGYTGLIRKPS